MIKKFESFKSTEDEKPMAKVQLDTIIDNVKCILDCLEDLPEDLPAWVQDKISVSNHNMDSISKWCKTNDVNENKSEKTKGGKSVSSKYLTKDKKSMKKEIDKYSGKSEYKKDWDADYKSGKGGDGVRYKTKESESTKSYKKKFEDILTTESVDDKNSKSYKGLKKKSEDSGISMTVLKQVYKRGMAAWNSGHVAGTPQNAWAMGRVNSFITGSGGARKADDDLWKKAKKQKDKK